MRKMQAAVNSASMIIAYMSLRRSRRLLASSQAFACGCVGEPRTARDGRATVGFIVTNLARSAESSVSFYNQRGTCEQYIMGGLDNDGFVVVEGTAGSFDLLSLAVQLGTGSDPFDPQFGSPVLAELVTTSIPELLVGALGLTGLFVCRGRE